MSMIKICLDLALDQSIARIQQQVKGPGPHCLVGYRQLDLNQQPLTHDPLITDTIIKALMRKFQIERYYYQAEISNNVISDDNAPTYTLTEVNREKSNFFSRHLKKLIAGIGGPLVAGGVVAGLLFFGVLFPPFGLTVMAAMGIVAAICVVPSLIIGIFALVQRAKENKQLKQQDDEIKKIEPDIKEMIAAVDKAEKELEATIKQSLKDLRKERAAEIIEKIKDLKIFINTENQFSEAHLKELAVLENFYSNEERLADLCTHKEVDDLYHKLVGKNVDINLYVGNEMDGQLATNKMAKLVNDINKLKKETAEKYINEKFKVLENSVSADKKISPDNRKNLQESQIKSKERLLALAGKSCKEIKEEVDADYNAELANYLITIINDSLYKHDMSRLDAIKDQEVLASLRKEILGLFEAQKRARLSLFNENFKESPNLDVLSRGKLEEVIAKDFENKINEKLNKDLTPIALHARGVQLATHDTKAFMDEMKEKYTPKFKDVPKAGLPSSNPSSLMYRPNDAGSVVEADKPENESPSVPVF